MGQTHHLPIYHPQGITMSSYDSTRLGYPPHPQYPQQQPPYPTTPGAAPPPQQPTNYFPPIPEQQPIYSSSPTSSYGNGTMTSMPQPHMPSHRRTSSSSSYNSQRPTHIQPGSPAIPIRQPDPQSYQYQYQHPGPPAPTSYPPPVTYAPQAPPIYARSSSQQSHYSHHSSHAHNAHAYADGEDKYEDEHRRHHDQHYGELDPETEREYKRRYAKEREVERRPTLGGSLLSTIGKIGGLLGGDRR